MTLIKKKEDEFYSPWPRIVSVSLVIAMLGTILFTILYLHLQIDWIESLANTIFYNKLSYRDKTVVSSYTKPPVSS